MTGLLSLHGPRPVPRWFLPGLAAIFFLSGSSALLYQVLWLRMLGLVFGVTVYAASTVWASFMAGLAIGSFAAGRVADRLRRPLLGFAAAELGIGLSAMATPWMLRTLQARFLTFSPALLDTSFASATALRFGISFLVLLVPTALMGATLPLVLRSSSWSPARLGASSALLYGSNTAGAIAGALAAGLYCIPMLGLTATFRIAGTLNLVAALAAAEVVRRVGTATPSRADDAAVPAVASRAGTTAGARAVVLATFAVSGAVSLGLELIWLRMSILILGPTVYTVSLLLAGVLLGIAAGSYGVALLLRQRRPGVVTLAILEAAIAMSAVLSMLLLTKVPAVVAALPAGLAGLVPAYLLPIAVASLIVAAPPMLLMGVAFPIGLQLWAVRADDPTGARFASGLGTFYSLNVFGAIAGSLLMGFYVLPRYGSGASTLLAAGATMASAIALVAVAQLSPTVRLACATAMAGAFVLLARAVPSTVDMLLLLRHPGEPILWREEGVQTTASIQSIEFGRHRALYLDGYHQADDTGGQIQLHHQIGGLPLAVHPNPRTALVVGLGGGATPGVLARPSSVDVTVIELADTVVRAAAFFQNINFNVLQRPNVHLHLDDGRNFLALTDRRYDIITADAIQPIRAGSASLYSVEYFELVKHALTDGGLALQWVGGNDTQWRLTARTFLTVFPDATVWAGGNLFVGTKHPLRLDQADFALKREIPGFTDAFETIGVKSFDDLVGLFLAGPTELRRFVGEGPILTDDRPILEYFLSQPDVPLDLDGLQGSVTPYLER
jgi:spermidine synthase